MNNTIMLVVTILFFVGGLILVSDLFEDHIVDATYIAVPPTPAVQKINIQTSPWQGNDTWINATTSNELIYFVSDGSIIFNVTESYP